MSVFGLCDCKICGSCETSEDFTGVSLLSYNHHYSHKDSYELEWVVKCTYCGLSVSDEYKGEVIEKWNKLNE